MSVPFNIAAINTKLSSETPGQPKGDFAPRQISRKESLNTMSGVATVGQPPNSGQGLSDIGKANPFSNALKKQLLSQTQQDTDETVSSKQEQKAKIKSLPTQEAKTKETKTSDNISEMACATAVLSPLPEPQRVDAIKRQAASLPQAAAPLNNRIQRQTNLKQPWGISQQGEKQSGQAPKTAVSQTMPSLQATVKKNGTETMPEVKTESVAVEKTATPQIEIKQTPKNFQSRAVQHQVDSPNVVQPAAPSPIKMSPTQPQNPVQVQIQAQTQVQVQTPLAASSMIPAQSPQIQQNQVKQQAKSSLTTSSISPKQSPQHTAKKEGEDKKAALPDKIASVESFQYMAASQKSQQNIAESAPQTAEKTGVISIDSAGRQEALKPADQILQHIPTTITGSFQQIRMTLLPVELGSIRITFRQQDEQVSGIVEVEKAAVQKDIEKAMPQIVSAMADSGIQLRRIEVIPMQNTPNSPNNQLSQDFNPSDHRHPAGQASDQSLSGNTFKNSSSQAEERGEDEISSKPQQILENSSLNMYA